MLPTLSPAEFVSLVNQTLDYAYPSVTIIGEVKSFKVNRNLWVYFDIADDEAKVKCFMTVHKLTSEIQDGMMVEITVVPRLHQQFGFSLNVNTIKPVGEGSIKKSADLLRKKLEAEGLFAPERKRSIPRLPRKIALITSEQSAAYADFIKILNHRWQGVEVLLFDVVVQGDQAPDSITKALSSINQLSDLPDLVVVIRGGGSIDDLSAFSSEQVTRAVAGCRIPTIVAIGHEVDVSLAELAADLRASTPSNAAELIFPDKNDYQTQLTTLKQSLNSSLINRLEKKELIIQNLAKQMLSFVDNFVSSKVQNIEHAKSILHSTHPDQILKRGFSLVRADGKLVYSANQIKINQILSIKFSNGNAKTRVVEVQ
jgi:exodeoxyribonuclease VII large subunit